jgi:SanA protein
MPSDPPAPARRRWGWGWRGWVTATFLAGAVHVAGANIYLVAAARPAIVADAGAAPVRPYAIVLGNRVFADGTPCPELEARLETALALYRAGRAAKIVLSGARARDYNEPRAMAAWMEARGVKAADIVADEGGHRTAATMKDSAALGARSALIVTQGYHLPRALFLARRAGIEAVGVAAPVRRSGVVENVWVTCRETAARAEAVLEVAFRGVR